MHDNTCVLKLHKSELPARMIKSSRREYASSGLAAHFLTPFQQDKYLKAYFFA